MAGTRTNSGNRLTYFIFIIASLFIFGLWLYARVIAQIFLVYRDNEIAELGQIGDSFGAITSLFTGIALVFVVAGVWIQWSELREAMKIFSEQSKGLKDQANATEYQLRLSLLSVAASSLSETVQAQRLLSDYYRKGIQKLQEPQRRADWKVRHAILIGQLVSARHHSIALGQHLRAIVDPTRRAEVDEDVRSLPLVPQLVPEDIQDLLNDTQLICIENDLRDPELILLSQCAFVRYFQSTPSQELTKEYSEHLRILKMTYHERVNGKRPDSDTDQIHSNAISWINNRSRRLQAEQIVRNQ